MDASLQAPLQPIYVLRGHASEVHALHFYRANTRLVTGDASGWVIIWNVSSRRSVAVWKAHDSSILNIKDWDEDKIITWVCGKLLALTSS